MVEENADQTVEVNADQNSSGTDQPAEDDVALLPFLMVKLRRNEETNAAEMMQWPAVARTDDMEQARILTEQELPQDLMPLFVKDVVAVMVNAHDMYVKRVREWMRDEKLDEGDAFVEMLGNLIGVPVEIAYNLLAVAIVKLAVEGVNLVEDGAEATTM